MTLARRATHALLAAAAIAAIVAGIPTALWQLTTRLIGNRWPDVPLVELLTRPDDGTLLLGFLALVGAWAWLVLTLSILSEFLAALTHRPALRIQLPGFRLGRSIAAALVAMLLGAGPAVAGPAIGLSAAITTNPAEHGPAAALEPSGPIHVVGDRETLWQIAENELADPLRWREIFELNRDRPQPDGGRLTEASVLRAGWEPCSPPAGPSRACRRCRYGSSPVTRSGPWPRSTSATLTEPTRSSPPTVASPRPTGGCSRTPTSSGLDGP